MSKYVGVAPAELRFQSGAHGKPALPEGRLRFNLAHSQGYALYALAGSREVGIDIEEVRPMADADRVAERFFSPQEVAALRALPENERLEGFFRCWTRKEAFVKARGEGLTAPLDEFSVPVAEPSAPVTRFGPPDAVHWCLIDLKPGGGHVAALVVEGSDWHLSCWHWTPDLI